MALADFYPVIKASHVGFALLSGSLFAVRGVGVLLGSATPMARPVRWFSQAVDTALLGSALLLAAVLQLAPFAQSWLQAKLALLVAYIVLGTWALRRAPTRAGKAVAFALALLCFACMLAIARSHDPLGFLRILTF